MLMSSYIFLVGRTDSHYESATAIHNLGYKVGIFQDTDVPLDDPAKFDAVISVDFSAPDLAIDIPSDITIAGLQCTYENYIVAKARIAHKLNLPSISVDAARACTDKLLMREAFAQKSSGFTPQFAVAATIDDTTAFAKQYGYPVIIKPTNLVKSLLVMRCDNEEELRSNFEFALNNIDELYKKYGVKDRPPQLIIEQFVTGKLCSIAAFVDHTGAPHFCEGIVSLTTAHEHGADDNYLYARTLPLEVSEDMRSKLFAAANSGIRALDMRSTAAHVELIYTNDSVYIIEIGARIGGYRPRMYQASYGLDLHSQEVNLSIGKTPELNAVYDGPVSVLELFPDTSGTYDSIANETTLRALPSVVYFSIKSNKGDRVGKAAEGYKASAIIILKANNSDQLSQDLAYIGSNVHVKVS